MKTLKSVSIISLRGVALAGLLAAAPLARATATFWTGTTNTFTHAAFTSTPDKLTTNHVGLDATNNVWLLRNTSLALYNSAAESAWNGSGPKNTLWVLASGQLTNADKLTYGTFASVVGHPGGASPGNSVNKTFFVHIVSDDIYLVLKLTAWGNNNGGSFSYQRSSPAVVLPTPTITITNPVAAAVFAAPASVTLGASAAVSSGSVTNVQFFTNGFSAGFVLAPPFNLAANNLAAGAYAVTAVATAGGISATSSVVNFTVLAPPAITLTNPVDGTVFAAPANVKLGASASVSGSTVTNVQFFTNGIAAGSALTTPFTLTANNLASGAYALKAVATASGISTTSSVVNVSVVSPNTVNLAPAGLQGGLFVFSYSANAGLSYIIQSSTNLLNWVSLATNVAASNPVMFTNQQNSTGLNFYRVGRLPNP